MLPNQLIPMVAGVKPAGLVYSVYVAPTPNTVPDTPTISGETPGSEYIELTSSAFADDDVGDTHYASQWQVTTAADTGYASPYFDSGEDQTNLVSIRAEPLVQSTDYIARVRHEDDNYGWSSWASNLEFTTAAGGAVEPFFFDDFETATVGQAANTGKSGGDRNFLWAGPSRCKVTDDISHAGSKCIKFIYLADDDPANPDAPDAWAEQRFSFDEIVGPDCEFGIEYYIYFPDGTEGLGSVQYHVRDTGGNDGHKCGVVLWGTTYSANYHVGFGYQGEQPENDGHTTTHASASSNYFQQLTDEVPYMSIFDGSSGGPLIRGQWNRVRFYQKASTTDVSNDGILKAWANETQLFSETALHVWSIRELGNHITNGYLLGYANSGFADETYVFVDDVKFYDTDPGW